MRFLSQLFVSFLGVGYIRPFSASWGSLVSGIVLFFFWPALEIWIKLVVVLAVFFLGSVMSGRLERDEHIHDPHFIVIDEVVGMMITCFFLPQVWWQWLIGFVLFRVFDVWKFWPASVFDEESGGLAIMLDDVIMALPALISLHFILILASHSPF